MVGAIMDKKSTELVTKAKKLISTDMRGKPMTKDVYFQRISEINSVATGLYDVASVGFYKIGQLLVRAKKELKGDFGKLKKALVEEGLHEKTQERYMSIARNENIKLNYSKLPIGKWTTWEKLSRLTDKQFNDIQHLISKDVQWNELQKALGTKGSSVKTGYYSNVKDNRSEIFGLEYLFLRGTKKHKEEFKELEQDIKLLARKYSFIKLKKKNYLVEVKDMLNEEKVKDDTTSENAPKFDKHYQSQKKIDI